MKTLCFYKRVLAGFSMLIIFLTATQAQTAKEVAQKTLPSVVVLIGEGSNGKPISLGSGFFILQITAAISEGSSGGPILNESGEVIGIAVASLRGGQNLNFAVSGQDLEAIIYRTVGEGFGVEDFWSDIPCADEKR